MTFMPLTLDDKYEVDKGRVFLTGLQALVRLPLMQHELDRRAGLNTAGFISGYRGSPLGGFDQQLWRAQKFLDRRNIVFKPGVNEDLAATAVWGSQQANLHPGAKYDGVFGMWYGKAPGVDRSGDAFRHANAAGTWPLGGVLAVAGDDHACKSSTLPCQSEFAFVDAEIPILNPAGIQEVLDFGIYGWALSRYAGTWVSMIALAETMDASATVEVHPHRVPNMMPTGFAMPKGGLGIRLGDTPQAQERRLREYKLPAVIAFAQANVLNRLVMDSERPRIGIVSAGKSYLDLRQALDDLGIGDKEAAALGLRVLKIGMTWPMEPTQIARFAHGLEEIFVIEEKRELIEAQIKSILFNMDAALRPRVYGKQGRDGMPLIRSTLDLDASYIALAVAKIVGEERWTPRMRALVTRLKRKYAEAESLTALYERAPYYCSGCPHNSSTKVPDGSLAMAGIGCHYMVTKMDRNTDLFTQMGGEGVPWIGAEPFTTREHMFANLGDGTYFHSGLLAIRAAVSAGVNVTYKILYNDAVAMTGGQQVDGALRASDIAAQVSAEGVKHVVVMSDEPDKYAPGDFPPHIKIADRRELDAVQKSLREVRGVSVLIYDQTCAAEKRRRRKRGLMDDPPKRVFINDLVCEGCGDCSVASNCLSVEPLETEFGRKRKINQSSCNKDFSCVQGFCPSFVTVHGGKLRKHADNSMAGANIFIPRPRSKKLSREPFNIMIGGIGGTGVTSIGAILGTAAHMEKKSATVLDMMGLAQKGGSVVSYVRLAAEGARINGPRIPVAQADLLLGCDIVVAARPETAAYVADDRTFAVVNEGLVPTAAFVKDNAIEYDTAAMRARVVKSARHLESIDADDLALRLLGDTIFANMLLMGYAYQLGEIPIDEDAIGRAIELNGASIEQNKAAFRFGRLAAHDRNALLKLAGVEGAHKKNARTFEEIVETRAKFLEAYQDRAYAERYRAKLDRVRAAEAIKTPGRHGLAEAAAQSLFKVMAYKDEYEVARLYSSGDFRRKVDAEFSGDFKLHFHLAPPIFGAVEPATARPRKIEFGPWMMRLFQVLAALKGLRGTWFDVFAHMPERKLERKMIADYEALLSEISASLTAANHATAIGLAALPLDIKGYGHVKEENYAKAKAKEAVLLRRLRMTDADHSSVIPVTEAAE
ncbi:MAG: indolepyruvate ferredoxin oxidoreductase family protein [Alphaproteobacteria bacterium]|nr:indolepyruvate ferredoxin oxidoreductase family protein [Alphaproteobacteria bacterium]